MVGQALSRLAKPLAGLVVGGYGAYGLARYGVFGEHEVRLDSRVEGDEFYHTKLERKLFYDQTRTFYNCPHGSYDDKPLPEPASFGLYSRGSDRMYTGWSIRPTKIIHVLKDGREIDETSACECGLSMRG